MAITWEQRDGKWPLVQLGKHLLMFAKTLHKHLPVLEHFVPSQGGPRETALSVPRVSGDKGDPPLETAAPKTHSDPSCEGSGALIQDTGPSQRAQGLWGAGSRALPCFRLVKGRVYCPMKSFLVDMSKSSTTNRTRASAGTSMSNVNSSFQFGLKPGHTDKDGGQRCWQ